MRHLLVRKSPLVHPPSRRYTPKYRMDPAPSGDGKPLMRHLLRLGSSLLAVLTLGDLAHESWTSGLWRSTPALANVYAMTVGAYAFTRESEKWTDPAAQESFNGHWFIYAWHALPAALWLAGVTCLAQVSFPAAVVDTFKLVLAAYAGSKASGRWRGKKNGTLPPAAQELTPDQYLSRHALRHGAMLLGAVCWLDCALEAFTVGEWHFAPGLYQCYAYSLSAYAGTRQWEKWTDPADKDAHWGGAFVGAWLGLTAAITIWRAMGHYAMWPESLNFSVGTVLAVFVGSKASVGLRDSKAKDWGNAPAKPLPQAPDPAGVGDKADDKPAEQPKQKTEPVERPPEAHKDGPPPKRPVDPSKVNPEVIAACKSLLRFRKVDLAEALGVSEPAARGYVGVLSRAGLIESDGDGWYRWIGG